MPPRRPAGWWRGIGDAATQPDATKSAGGRDPGAAGSKDLRLRERGVKERIATTVRQVASLERQVGDTPPVAEQAHVSKKLLWDMEDQLLARQGELASLEGEAEEIGETGSAIEQQLTDQRRRAAAP